MLPKTPTDRPPSRRAGLSNSGGDSSSGGGSGNNSEVAQTKAQQRRAQVRKAQIQHRQRKANYTKELEMDITRLRDMIEQAEKDGRLLKTESDALRRQITMRALAAGAFNLTLPPPVVTTYINLGTVAQPPQPAVAMTAEWNIPLENEYTIRMEMNDLMQTPAFSISRTPNRSASSQTMDIPSASGVLSTSTATSLPPSAAVGALTPEQTEMAINFILALEHICWNHFHHAYFDHTSYDPEGMEHGHALMASHIALQTASPEVFSRINDVRLEAAAAAREDPPRGHATLAVPEGIEWQAPRARPASGGGSGLDLEALYGLATTLNPPDRELAPVQAWFEIVRAYGPDVGLDPVVIEGLKREFAGVVKCLHFGAVIERDAFDAIVARVVAARLGDLGVDMGMDLSIEDAGYQEGGGEDVLVI
ncbi:hypothetical protein BX600DRAFT_534868 [Xylariales sp. PMI_506]|nr:hypothetical protein BX600DRAFT_534868 [Xylariales sp. PMI_506]